MICVSNSIILFVLPLRLVYRHTCIVQIITFVVYCKIVKIRPSVSLFLKSLRKFFGFFLFIIQYNDGIISFVERTIVEISS